MASLSGSVTACALGLLCALAPGPALTAPCGGDFNAWLEDFSKEAAAQGVSQGTLDAALDGLTPDPQVLALDRNQNHTFNKTFEQFSSTRVTPYAVQRGQSLMNKNAALLASIEAQYGVPGPILVAIWGLETSFGGDNGSFPTFRSLATLAWDCRRPERFRAEEEEIRSRYLTV